MNKWDSIAIIAIILAMMVPMIAIGFSSDKESARIAACMLQPNMQYVDGDCIPQ